MAGRILRQREDPDRPRALRHVDADEPAERRRRRHAAARRHGKVLLAVEFIGDRRTGNIAVEPRLPEQLAGPVVQRKELPVGRATEDDAAGRRKRRCGHRCPAIGTILPRALAGDRVERDELTDKVIAWRQRRRIRDTRQPEPAHDRRHDHGVHAGVVDAEVVKPGLGAVTRRLQISRAVQMRADLEHTPRVDVDHGRYRFRVVDRPS